MKARPAQNSERTKAEIHLTPEGTHISLVGTATAVIAIVAVIGLIIIATKALRVAERAVDQSGGAGSPQSVKR